MSEFEYAVTTPKFGNLFYRKTNVAYTHNGIFHADDVCSAALLEIAFPGIEIKRVSSVPENAELAFDIGYGKYDHHQSDCEYREDGNKYAAFGLLWRDLGPTILSKSDVKHFDDVFVKQIDYTDNTGFPNPFSTLIKSMNPSWNEEGEADNRFREAVEYAKTGILSTFKRYMTAKSAETEMQSIINDKDNYASEHVLILNQYMPYHKATSPSPIHFVMFPSNRTPNAWNINTVPQEIGGRVPKTELPEGWVQSPPFGCTFINSSMTMAVFTSKENALNVVSKLEKAISLNEKGETK